MTAVEEGEEEGGKGRSETYDSIRVMRANIYNRARHYDGLQRFQMEGYRQTIRKGEEGIRTTEEKVPDCGKTRNSFCTE